MGVCRVPVIDLWRQLWWAAGAWRWMYESNSCARCGWAEESQAVIITTQWLREEEAERERERGKNKERQTSSVAKHMNANYIPWVFITSIWSQASCCDQGQAMYELFRKNPYSLSIKARSDPFSAAFQTDVLGNNSSMKLLPLRFQPYSYYWQKIIQTKTHLVFTYITTTSGI